MVAIIRGKPDTLDEVGRQFDRARLTTPVFLNSVPKAGTHLIRNILRMFVEEPQHWRKEFIQHPNLRHSLEAFSPEKPMLSWGHLLFSDEASLAVRPARHIVLVRDPYDWVLARTRFYLSDEFKGPMEGVKGGRAPMGEIINMMIFGVHQKVPSLLDVYTANALSWMGGPATVVRYEDLVEAVKDLGSRRAERLFTRLLADCGLETPLDWQARVEAGADRRQSSTARENLSLSGEPVPESLSDTHRRLVDFAAPGLRSLLGYG